MHLPFHTPSAPAPPAEPVAVHRTSWKSALAIALLGLAAGGPLGCASQASSRADAHRPAIATAPSRPQPTPSPAPTSSPAHRGSDGSAFPSSPIAKPGSVPVVGAGANALGFDRSRYLADPAAYLQVVAPSRSWTVAQPGPAVPLLQLVGGGAFTAAVGQSVLLQARTEPGMPVTFASLGLGAFPGTGLSAQSVAADAAGIAQVEFAITTGTTGAVSVVAGSPVCAGTVEYLIHVP